MKIFKMDQVKTHSFWNKDIDPVAYLDSEDEIIVETKDSSDGQIDLNSDSQSLLKMDFSRVNPSTGPFYINGAKKGDTLKIEILEIENKGWGWTGIIPGFGLFAGDTTFYQEELAGPSLKIWKSDKKYSKAKFGDIDIEIINEPFIGTIGVAPLNKGTFSIIPPREHGGNMDQKFLGPGSTLYLPVFNDGALLSFGDIHLAQGDGEVCGTAIEAPATVKLKISVIKGTMQGGPYFSFKKVNNYNEYLAFSGFSNNLMDATKIAVMRMINTFSNFIEPQEAYMLASVALDLKISEIVDIPNFNVTGVIPLDIIKDKEIREKLKTLVK